MVADSLDAYTDFSSENGLIESCIPSRDHFTLQFDKGHTRFHLCWCTLHAFTWRPNANAHFGLAFVLPAQVAGEEKASVHAKASRGKCPDLRGLLDLLRWQVRGAGDAASSLGPLGAAVTLPCLRRSAGSGSAVLTHTRHPCTLGCCNESHPVDNRSGPGQSRGLTRSKTCELWKERPS